MFIPVIMAGGTGSRLWPLSRQLKPKQFFSLCGERTLLQDTVLRLDGLEHADPIIICNEEHRFLIAEQLREIGIEKVSIILEPVGRNTAPAVALAALCAEKYEEDYPLLVLAADHVIEDTEVFQAGIRSALTFAEQGQLVTFGITPLSPETGYGYIKKGEGLAQGINKVAEFVEKPDREVAQSYLETGNFLWNSGMFCFTSSSLLQELELFSPKILDVCRKAYVQSSNDMGFLRVDDEIFSRCPEDSIDYAVMEHTQKSVVIELDASWNDVGSWSALWSELTKDQNNNVLRGDIITHDTQNSLIRAEDRLVTTIGIDNLVVIETKDAILVADKEKVQQVKSIVSHLKQGSRTEHISHREVYRPWGSYETVAAGQRYQVKKITVQPGQKLSTQMHHHRAEHWVVVSGTARVTIGDDVSLVSENQSTYIPIGEVHCLENPGKIPLEIIEVQSGDYLGEDDIVRILDPYGRK